MYMIMNSSSFIDTHPNYSRRDFLPAIEPDSFGWTFLPAVLTFLFCIYVLFIQDICSTYFLFFYVFFLAPNIFAFGSSSSPYNYFSMLYIHTALVLFFLPSYFTSKLFCFLCDWLLFCPCAFSTDLVKFSLIIWECPV